MTLLNRAARDTLKKSPDTDIREIIKHISGGNPGALTAAANIAVASDVPVIILTIIRDMGVVGSHFWILWKYGFDCDLEKFKEFCAAVRQKQIEVGKIHECLQEIPNTPEFVTKFAAMRAKINNPNMTCLTLAGLMMEPFDA